MMAYAPRLCCSPVFLHSPFSRILQVISYETTTATRLSPFFLPFAFFRNFQVNRASLEEVRELSIGRIAGTQLACKSHGRCPLSSLTCARFDAKYAYIFVGISADKIEILFKNHSPLRLRTTLRPLSQTRFLSLREKISHRPLNEIPLEKTVHGGDYNYEATALSQSI